MVLDSEVSMQERRCSATTSCCSGGDGVGDDCGELRNVNMCSLWEALGRGGSFRTGSDAESGEVSNLVIM